MKNSCAIRILFVLSVVVIAVVTGCVPERQSTQPDNQTWLSPGKVQISNLKSGSSVQQKIQLHNGSDGNNRFSVYYRVADYTENGFASAPAGAKDWVTVDDDYPQLAARETKDILVTLVVPDNVQTPSRWEFWIGVKSNSGNSIAAELCSRWLVTMKN